MNPEACCYCGSDSHTSPHCPWKRKRTMSPLAALGSILALVAVTAYRRGTRPFADAMTGLSIASLGLAGLAYLRGGAL